VDVTLSDAATTTITIASIASDAFAVDASALLLLYNAASAVHLSATGAPDA
jgi:hypothetical protein